MDMRAYTSANGLTLSSFAVKLGVSQGAFHDYVTGRRAIPLRFALEIERLTNGEVRPADWICDCPGIAA